MSLLEKVRTDMRVIDANGTEGGTVEDVKLGDPEAVTATGQQPTDRTEVTEVVRDAFAVNRLDAERQARLLRMGYLKVDSKGLFTSDEYVASDHIERVAGDTVYLKIALAT